MMNVVYYSEIFHISHSPLFYSSLIFERGDAYKYWLFIMFSVYLRIELHYNFCSEISYPTLFKLKLCRACTTLWV